MTESRITPPPELIRQWEEDWHHSKAKHIEYESYLATRAAQWGADQELEATLAEVSFLNSRALADRVRAARRPNPSSLKKQACKLLECYGTSGVKLTADQCNTILRALESLPND